MTIPFGRKRLIIGLSESTRPQRAAASARIKSLATPGLATKFPEAIAATDRELVMLTHRAAAEADRRQWQALAITRRIRIT